MTITVDPAQRDQLYRDLLLDLSGIQDVVIEIDAGNFIEAQLLRQRFFAEFRLLDDLGWQPTSGRSLFELTVPAEELLRIVGRFYEQALSELHDRAAGASDEEAGTPGENARRLRLHLQLLLDAARVAEPKVARSEAARDEPSS